MKRANYLGAPQAFVLAQACRIVWDSYGGVYLVGSCLERRDFRDVDVRCILDDDKFDRLFPGIGDSSPQHNARWSLLCASISLYLSQHSGLPVDFQFQRRTDANATYPDQQRQAIGAWLAIPEDA